MTMNLEQQVREYAEFLDTTLPVIDPDAITSTVPEVVPVVVASEPRRGFARRPWFVVAAAVAFVVVLIGGASLVFSGSDPGPVIDEPTTEPSTTVTTLPESTTVASDPDTSSTTSVVPSTTAPNHGIEVPLVEESIYFTARWSTTGVAAEDELGGPIERVETVWYLDSDTWRWETPQSRVGDSTELEGQVTVVAGGERFEYSRLSNAYTLFDQSEEVNRFDPTIDGELFTPVQYDCDGSTCVRPADGDLWASCTRTSDVTLIGVSTSEYTCGRSIDLDGNGTAEDEALTVNLDDTGRTIRMRYDHTLESGDHNTIEYELLEFDTSPTLTSDLFAFECPTSDCRDSAIPPDPFEHPLVGQPAPNVTGGLIGGGSFDLEEHRGEHVVLLLWSSWCPPCTEELAMFQGYSDTVPGHTIVTGAVIDQQQDVEALVADLSITLPVIDLYTQNLSQGNYPGDVWGSGVPTTVFIDQNGTVVAVHTEARGIDGLARTLDQLDW